MEKLLEAMAKAGLEISAETPEEKVVKAAKAIGIDPTDYLPRPDPVIEPYTNGKGETNVFVKLPDYTVGRKKNGMADTRKGMWIRLEALDQTIEDLLKARGMRDNEEEG